MPDVADLIEARITKARERDAHLQRTAEGIEVLRRQIAKEVEQLEIALSVLRDVTGDSVDAPETAAVPTDSPSLEGLTVADATEAVLRSRGGQAETGEILRELRAAGRISSTQGSYATLKKALERHPDRFAKIGRGLWSLVEAAPEQMSVTAYVSG